MKNAMVPPVSIPFMKSTMSFSRAKKCNDIMLMSTIIEIILVLFIVKMF